MSDYDYLPVSNGSGDAALMNITASRLVGGTTITVDSTTNVPTKFIGTYGTLLATNLLDPTTKRDFKGHVIDATHIGIDAFEPGSTDSANLATGQVIVVKPNTGWANRIASFIKNATGFGTPENVTFAQITAAGLINTGPLTQTGAFTPNGSWDGWIGANESWSFASSTTITVPTDATTKYDVGDYIKITQSATVKYFVIMSLTSTVLTVSGFNGVTVANSAITANAYSKARNPHGAALEYLSNLPFVQTQANAGTAGGTINYLNLGGIKLMWGTTASCNGTGSPTFTITFPAFFTTVQTVQAFTSPNTNVQTVCAVAGLATTGLTFYIFKTDTPGSGSTIVNAVYWFVIGT